MHVYIGDLFFVLVTELTIVKVCRSLETYSDKDAIAAWGFLSTIG